MLYELEVADDPNKLAVERDIVKQHIQQGVKPPENLLQYPTLLPGLELFYFAFMALRPCMSISSFGESNIPRQEIVCYCNENGIQGYQAELVEQYVRGMESAYKHWLRSKTNVGNQPKELGKKGK